MSGHFIELHSWGCDVQFVERPFMKIALMTLPALIALGVLFASLAWQHVFQRVSLTREKRPPDNLAAELRQFLFGDMPIDRLCEVDSSSTLVPWSYYHDAKTHLEGGNPSEATRSFQDILDTPGLETRHYLQAWTFLRSLGHDPPAAEAKTVLGVVVEMSAPEGLIITAAYQDRHARFYNSGGGVIWEHTDDSVDAEILRLLQAGQEAVQQIVRPSEGGRPDPPPSGEGQLSFLTPNGLYVRQAPFNELDSDPNSAKVVSAATELSQALMANTRNRKPLSP